MRDLPGRILLREALPSYVGRSIPAAEDDGEMTDEFRDEVTESSDGGESYCEGVGTVVVPDGESEGESERGDEDGVAGEEVVREKGTEVVGEDGDDDEGEEDVGSVEEEEEERERSMEVREQSHDSVGESPDAASETSLRDLSTQHSDIDHAADVTHDTSPTQHPNAADSDLDPTDSPPGLESPPTNDRDGDVGQHQNADERLGQDVPVPALLGEGEVEHGRGEGAAEAGQLRRDQGVSDTALAMASAAAAAGWQAGQVGTQQQQQQEQQQQQQQEQQEQEQERNEQTGLQGRSDASAGLGEYTTAHAEPGSGQFQPASDMLGLSGAEVSSHQQQQQQQQQPQQPPNTPPPVTAYHALGQQRDPTSPFTLVNGTPKPLTPPNPSVGQLHAPSTPRMHFRPNALQHPPVMAPVNDLAPHHHSPRLGITYQTVEQLKTESQFPNTPVKTEHQQPQPFSTVMHMRSNCTITNSPLPAMTPYVTRRRATATPQSPVWNHYDILIDGESQGKRRCCHCQAVFSPNSSTSTLARHLKRHRSMIEQDESGRMPQQHAGSQHLRLVQQVHHHHQQQHPHQQHQQQHMGIQTPVLSPNKRLKIEPGLPMPSQPVMHEEMTYIPAPAPPVPSGTNPPGAGSYYRFESPPHHQHAGNTTLKFTGSEAQHHPAMAAGPTTATTTTMPIRSPQASLHAARAAAVVAGLSMTSGLKRGRRPRSLSSPHRVGARGSGGSSSAVHQPSGLSKSPISANDSEDVGGSTGPCQSGQGVFPRTPPGARTAAPPGPVSAYPNPVPDPRTLPDDPDSPPAVPPQYTFLPAPTPAFQCLYCPTTLPRHASQKSLQAHLVEFHSENLTATQVSGYSAAMLKAQPHADGPTQVQAQTPD